MLMRRLGILDRSEASCCGITLAQCHVIVELGRAEKMSVNDMADLLRLDKSTISRSVDNLVNTGLVLRETDPEDRRYVALKLSDKGVGIYTDLESRMGTYYSEIVELLPVDKREQVIESLILLAEAVISPKCCEISSDSSSCGKEEKVNNNV